jgi:hypothetical protein
MQNIIQIHLCLLKLSRKQESVTDGQTDGRNYYIPHRYRGGIINFEWRSALERVHFTPII